MVMKLLILMTTFCFLEQTWGSEDSPEVTSEKKELTAELIRLLDPKEARKYSEDQIKRIAIILQHMSDQDVKEQISASILYASAKGLYESLDWGNFMGGDYSAAEAIVLRLLAHTGDPSAQYHYARYLLSQERKDYRQIGMWLLESARAPEEHEHADYAADALALLSFAGIEEDWVIGSDARSDSDLLDVFERGVQNVLQGK